ncbi:MAG: biotin transporter BioY [Methanoregulaceae archaeon]|jgi:biotin transport system substrate-specific component|nr:biotin transporter BioY [Methanoregulaceae archaeon]
MPKNPSRPLLIAETAAFTSLLALGAWVSIPFLPVPITLQTLFVILAGAVMGRYGIYPSSLYVLMGVLNIPVFHNGTAGIGILLGPTGGYILGFIPGSLAAGLAYEQRHDVIRVLGIGAGLFLIFFTGMTWLSFSTGMSAFAAFLVGVVPFLPGDALKGAAVFFIARRLEGLGIGPRGLKQAGVE